MQKIKDVLCLYNLKLLTVGDKNIVSGSSERMKERFLIYSEDGCRYVLEKLDSKDLENKRKINRVLTFLHQEMVDKIPRYLKNFNHEEISCFAGEYWQVREFVVGFDLPRPDYIYDNWRGKILADFLIEMKKSSNKMDFLVKNNFSLPKYIDNLMVSISNYRPELLRRVWAVYKYLESDFFKNYRYFPRRFCHGDFHPLNVIWSENDINCVIDWEFCGYKPESYDVANFLGCIGFEEPDAFNAGFVKDFMERLKEKKFLSKFSLNYLTDFVLALRFAWLSEWLRKDDEEMLELELVYWEILRSIDTF